MIWDVVPCEGYPEQTGLLLAVLQDATREWREELPSELPAEAITWRVRSGGQSIGAVLLHMIAAEIAWIEQFLLGRSIDSSEKKLLRWDEFDLEGGNWPDAPFEPLSWYYNLHDCHRTQLIGALEDLPAPELVKEGRKNSFSTRWVLGHIIQHESYHGGQILLLHDLWRHRS